MTRTCACGCDGSMEGKRPHARWYSDACRERAKRRSQGSTGRIGRPPKEQLYEVDANDCWIWLLGCTPDGYPVISRGKSRRAHAWMWEQIHGAVPDGFELHHTCERRRCVNPDHLELLTRAEHAKRHPRGGRQRRKLTDALVAAMRADTLSIHDAAAQAGCTYLAAWQAKTGRTWRHL